MEALFASVDQTFYKDEKGMITIDLDLRQAAAVREALFRSTAQDSYEFPSERTVEIAKQSNNLILKLKKY